MWWPESVKKFDEFDKQFKYDLSTLDSIDNKIEKKYIKQITYFEDSKSNHCDICQKNCHETWDCWFSFMFNRWRIFTFLGKICDVFGCEKKDHYYYKYHMIDDFEEKEKIEQRKLEKQK